MHLVKLAMNHSALRTWEISRSFLWKRRTLPHTRYRSRHSNFPFSPSPKRYIYNVAGVRGPTLTQCYEYHLWKPEESGYFFCKAFLREDLVHYRSGGYHPVHLGDTMKGGRYQIVQKLGWGRDATVWLAEDRRIPRHVAIKVLRSDRRHDEEEAKILKRLTESPTSHSGKSHIIQLLDLFELKGPNGRHLCLVIEAVGSRVDDGELSVKATWEVARQLVEATAYFHDLGVVHGDLYREKIRFSNTDLLYRNGNPMNPVKKPKLGNVRPVDKFGNVKSILEHVTTARVPRYLVEPLWTYPESISYDAVKDSGIKVIGFGEPYLTGKKRGANCAFHHQAPELVLSDQLDTRADIWSLGCMIYEIVIREHLIWDMWDTKDDLINEWITVFGDLPEELKSHRPPRTAEYPNPGEYGILSTMHHDLSNMYPGTKWFSKDSLDTLGDLLVSMMQYRPSDRPSASQVLQHPWFQRCPSFITVHAPTDGEEALSDLKA